MAVLVTGGAGFIGSHVVERLIARGSEVVVLDDFNNYYDPAIKEHNLAGVAGKQGLHIVRGDVADEAAVAEAFAIRRIRAVVHLAARAGVRPSLGDPLLYERANIRGALLILEQSRREGVERVVFASSSSVYGTTTRAPFTESDAADRPISPYSATKRAAELLCYTYSHLYGLPVTCLRLFTVYGPRQRPDLAIHTFTHSIWTGQPIRVFGDGASARDYTYVDDIVDGMLAALDRPAPLAYEIINLGNSLPVQLSALISLIEGALGRTAVIEQAPEQPGDVQLTYADIGKAQRLLGYRPRVQIEEGIQRFSSWYLREHGYDQLAGSHAILAGDHHVGAP
ncbi:MAG TPA: SDR family NAD(P)-dependent oxidoreductase [Ktedonobacterales bacterium]|jgi:UDP-glucuronate 4-epimerase|nr:SDR family NAD(P)-dependent oxidoreductase [Ktedonobacterales bacterium]